LCQRFALVRVSQRPVHPFSPDVEKLLMQISAHWKVFQRSGCHLGFELKIEMVKEVCFGLEVGEERSIRYTRFFCYARRRSAQALGNDDARRGFQNRAPLLVTPGSGHTLSV
jgi:hypothetical protein